MPVPMPENLKACSTAVEQRLGLVVQDGELALLSPQQWQALSSSMPP
jgi:hypothetical protein